jgi:hypothetical protein
VHFANPGARGTAIPLSGSGCVNYSLAKDRGLTLESGPAVIGLSRKCDEAERLMDPRFIFSALIGAFCAALIFATITSIRHVSHRVDSVVARPE